MTGRVDRALGAPRRRAAQRRAVRRAPAAHREGARDRRSRGHGQPGRSLAALMAVEAVFETHSLSEDNERGVATGWLEVALRAGQATGRGAGRAPPPGSSRGRLRVRPRTRGRDRRDRVRRHGDPAAQGLAAARVRLRRAERHAGRAAARGAAAPPRHAVSRRRELAGRRRAAPLVLLRRRPPARRRARAGDRPRPTWWAFDHLVAGEPLESLVAAPHAWQEGWRYTLDERFARSS